MTEPFWDSDFFRVILLPIGKGSEFWGLDLMNIRFRKQSTLALLERFSGSPKYFFYYCWKVAGSKQACVGVYTHPSTHTRHVSVEANESEKKQNLDLSPSQILVPDSGSKQLWEVKPNNAFIGFSMKWYHSIWCTSDTCTMPSGSMVSFTHHSPELQTQTKCWLTILSSST